MSKHLISEENMIGIADAIRSRHDNSLTYKPSEMRNAIRWFGQDPAAYYASISDAISGVNAVDDGVVCTFIDADGKYNVVMLADIASGVTIEINRDCIFHLNGYTLSFTAAGAYLNVTTATEVVIDGTVNGSEITKNISDGANERLISVTGTSLTVSCGTYSMYGKYSTFGVPIRNENAETYIVMRGAKVIVDADAGNSVYGCQLKGHSTIIGCFIKSCSSTAKFSAGINTNSELIVNDCTIISETKVQGGRVYTTRLNDGAVAAINNCSFVADGVGDVGDTGYNVCALFCNSGATSTIFGCNFKAAREGIVNYGNTYVYDSILEGCQHGGAYASGTFAAKNCTFRNISYFGDSGWNDAHYGTIYCGSSDYSGNVYLDNCVFETPSGQTATQGLVVKYSNVNVYLSNCEFKGTYTTDIRCDANNTVFIGKDVTYSTTSISGTLDTESYAGAICTPAGIESYNVGKGTVETCTVTFNNEEISGDCPILGVIASVFEDGKKQNYTYALDHRVETSMFKMTIQNVITGTPIYLISSIYTYETSGVFVDIDGSAIINSHTCFNSYNDVLVTFTAPSVAGENCTIYYAYNA